jgi:uncharacterized protein HemX
MTVNGGGKVGIVAVVTLLVGLGLGYLVWGAQARTQTAEMEKVQAALSAARQGASQEGALATKIQETERRIKQASEELAKETELREKLEKLAKAKKKP